MNVLMHFQHCTAASYIVINFFDQDIYHEEWEQEHDWVRKETTESVNAICKLCRAVSKPKISIFQKHENSTKHPQRVSALRQTMPLQETEELTCLNCFRDKNCRNKSGCCCLLHCAIYHISEIVSSYSNGSPLVK